jgi:hypothetical protein
MKMHVQCSHDSFEAFDWGLTLSEWKRGEGLASMVGELHGCKKGKVDTDSIWVTCEQQSVQTLKFLGGWMRIAGDMNRTLKRLLKHIGEDL